MWFRMNTECIVVTFIIITYCGGYATFQAAEEDVGDGTNYVTGTTPAYDLLTPTETPKSKDKDKWLIYVSAGPTVFIFLVCVIAISVKNCSEGDGKVDAGRSVLSPATTTTSPKIKRKAKPKIVNEVYDKMLEQFKDDKTKKKTGVVRKWSQMQVQGVESGSPKSLARKHLIIGNLTSQSSAEGVEDSSINTLVRKSTLTAIGGPLLQDIGKNESKDTEDSIEITNTVKEILRRSVENLTVADRRTFCDELDEVLLPEDLEDAFNNFDYWQESNI